MAGSVMVFRPDLPERSWMSYARLLNRAVEQDISSRSAIFRSPPKVSWTW